MANYKQINYIKTMVSQASRKTKEEFEDILLDKETPYSVVQYWINRLEKEIGRK